MKNFICQFFIVSISTLLSIHAQTGPGGIGSPTNNILWLNADSINSTHGSSIDYWMDISGNNNDALQSTLTHRPTIYTDTLNGHNAVSFDGVDDYMEFMNHITTDDVAIYLVLNNSTQNTSFTRYGITTEHHYLSSRHHNTQKTTMLYSGSRYNIKDWVSGKMEMISGQTIANDDLVRTSRRGVERTYINRNTLNNNSKSLLGALFDGNSASGYHWGNIAEVVIFNDTLNYVERKILMNALTAKYGSNMEALGSDIFAFQSTHSNHIIGIGKEKGYSHSSSLGKGTVRISNPDDLENGEYLMTGHDNAPLIIDTTDVPIGFESRLGRVWRADKKGDLGTITIDFFLDANTLSNLSLPYILIDDDGDFSNGGSILHDYGKSINIAQGLVSFSNVYIPDNYYFTLGTYDESNIISSVKSGDWLDLNTWSCSCIPDISSIVEIKNGHTISFNTEQAVNSININSGARIDFNANSILHIYDSLNIYGELYNNGNLIIVEGSKEVVFSNNTGTEIIFHSIEINNENGLVLNNSDWSLRNSIKIITGQLINNGNLKFVSDETKTAQILKSLPNSFIGNGTYTTQRYISNRKADFVNLSSPTSSTISDWDDEIFMSGVDGNDGNIHYGNSSSPIYYSVYKYDNVNQKYDTVTTINESILPGVGYEFFLGNDLNEYRSEELGTIDVQGQPTTGSVTQAVNAGFCFLGNPYQAFIDWSLVTKPTSMKNAYYVFNANSGNYSLYSASVPIAPGQAFWVEGPIGGIRNVTFNEDDKIYNNSNSTSIFSRKKNLISDSLMIELTNDVNNYWHEHIIEINSTSTIEEDENDMGYLKSRLADAPAIYSTINSQILNKPRKLLINSIDGFENNVSIPLSVIAGVDANYKLKFENIHKIASTYNCILLIDRKEGMQIDLMQNSLYKFYSAKGTSERFELKLQKNSLCEPSNEKISSIFSLEKMNGNYFLEYNLGENTDIVTVNIIDALGKEMKNPIRTKVKGNGYIKLNVANLKGVNIIQLDSESGRRYSEKIIF